MPPKKKATAKSKAKPKAKARAKPKTKGENGVQGLTELRHELKGLQTQLTLVQQAAANLSAATPPPKAKAAAAAADEREDVEWWIGELKKVGISNIALGGKLKGKRLYPWLKSQKTAFKKKGWGNALEVVRTTAKENPSVGGRTIDLYRPLAKKDRVLGESDEDERVREFFTSGDRSDLFPRFQT